jgi:hydrogenase maturation protein HypF
MPERCRIRVQGIVQGVGFRPFVFGLAQANGLAGLVRNDAQGVTIEVEGEASAIQRFVNGVRSNPPPLALIDAVATEPLPPCGAASFAIEPSCDDSGRAGKQALVSPDVSVCDDCLRELFDPTDRRYGYPFINCTNCGPRYSIIQAVPYDRPQTTMAPFHMCAACQREYDDPTNRRFHAQPNACPACGPQIRIVVGNTKGVTSNWQFVTEKTQIPVNQDELPITNYQLLVAQAQAWLASGAILAIKGLGGYHLACDAANAEAVERLRARKRRFDKPFALMAADVNAVQGLVPLGEAERAALSDRRRPIVLLPGWQGAGVASVVAPRLNSLGIMLPYTPLHHLLFAGAPYRLLVMTSGNLSDEPIAYDDADAFERLAPLADAFLTHDRAIHTRVDDSVVRVFLSPVPSSLPTDHSPLTTVLRRSRGFAPQPITLGFECPAPVLAVGAHLKNTFCLGRGRQAFLSQHIGDLDNLETLSAYRAAVGHLERLFDIQPEIIAHDLHPDYLSTQVALEREGVRRVGVQHHHAHIASVLAEHRLAGPVLGVAFDGTGYGLDGSVWGGEFLVASLAAFERAAYLRPVRMPGGEQAIRQPWRLAAAWLQTLYGDQWREWGLPLCNQPQLRGVLNMLARGVNSPLTSSMGRLFDAVAALLGVRDRVSYEGQAAIELEALAARGEPGAYPFALAGAQIDPAPMFEALLADLAAGAPVPVLAARFHNGVAALVVSVCRRLRAERGLGTVALSGGVFQNATLLTRALAGLEAAGFAVYTNQRVPPNDGGLALGQLAVAAAATRAQAG